MQPYQPEGIIAEPPGIEALHKGAHYQEIFRAMCVKCDENHNLHIDLGDGIGIIPKDEAVFSTEETAYREYAILSRVGKPVCFQVLRFDSNGTPILSRRAAMLDARSYFLSTLKPGDILQTRVVNTARFGLFCDIGCGFHALMPIQRCCISRLESTALQYKTGQIICAAVLEVKETKGQIVLTGRELLGTWEENVQHFRQGQTVTGTVRSIMPYGIFVELLPNLSGLAEPMPGIQAGDAVSVYLRAILPQKHKIKMNILEKLPCPLPIQQPEYYITSGHIQQWSYFPGSSAFTYF